MIVDIAFNITDKAFNADRAAVLERCRFKEVLPVFVGLDVSTSRECLKYSEEYKIPCYVGIHPTSGHAEVSELRPLLEHPSVVALGECGLDFDRIHFSPKVRQLRLFAEQLELRAETYFLHSRGCHREFMDAISDYSFKGVVHSFTGSLEEALECIKRGLFIGINGCSLKTEALMEMVKEIGLEDILVETDAPYCKIRRSSPAYSFVQKDSLEKSLMRRNEPCTVWQVVDALAAVKETTLDAVAEATSRNAIALFGPGIKQSAKEFLNKHSSGAL